VKNTARDIFLPAIIAAIIIVLLLNPSNSLSLQEPTNTVLVLHKFKSSTYNGGQPIVFQGKLTTESGERIPNAKIIIKNTGPCPENHIISEGITDKHGRFWIKVITQVWDKDDGLIKVYAEFKGDENFSPSVSDKYNIVVYPLKAILCEK